MFKIALKSLLGHKLRMLLTVSSIVIGVSFVAGSYIFTDSMRSTFDNIFEDAFASIDVTVRPVESGFTTSSLGGTQVVGEEVLERIQDLEEIDSLAAEVSGIAQLIRQDGELIGATGAISLGFSWTDDAELNALRINEGDGRAPESAREVAVDRATAVNNELSVGDIVRVQGNVAAEEYEIVGLLTFGESESLAGVSITAYTFEDARRLFGIEEGFSSINISAAEGIDADTLASIIEPLLPEGIEVATAEQQTNESVESINEGLGFLNTALLAFAAVSIFVGSFIIQNTFRIIIAQRSKELALLRAIGATKRQVINIVVYEALIISFISSILGIFAGIGISSALRSISNSIGITLPPGELTLEPRTIYVSLAVGVLVTLVSATLPAIKASRVSPVEGLSDNENSAPRKSLRKRALSGIAVTLFGAGLLFGGLFIADSRQLELVGFGAAVMFIGISIIAPLLSRPIAAIIGLPAVWRYGLIGRIAKGNTQRTPRRTASTAAALMIGVSLVVFVSIFASSLKATLDRVIEGNFPGDLTISLTQQSGDPTAATFPAIVADVVEELPEVKEVSRVKYDFVAINGAETLIVAAERETFNDAIFLEPNNNYEDLEIDTVYVNETTMENEGWSIGDTIAIEYGLTGESVWTISGSFKEAFDSPYIISSETYAANFSNDRDLLVIANVSDDFTIEEGKQAINAAIEDFPIVQVQDKGELIEDARQSIDQILGLMSALLGFAVIIAVLGITNTLTLSVSERTREIGMLRAIGMTRSQVRQMIRAEAVIIAVFGAILGVIMGIFFGWAMLRALEDLGFTSFSVPIGQIFVYLILSAFAGVFAAIFPSFKASRMNILNAINYQ